MSEMESSSQVSALFDGELDAAQSGLVTRRLLKDPALQASWQRYAMIGASLRGEPLLQRSGGQGDLAARLRRQLESEATLSAPGATVQPAAGRAVAPRRLAWGAALAASIAVAVIGVLRVQAPGLAEPLSAQRVAPAVAPSASRQATEAAPAQVARRDTPAPSYTTPLDTTSLMSQPTGQRLSAPLVNYVVAHSEYTTPVARFSPLTTVMSGNFDPSENTVEMTEAEVGARR
jgi:negative regulator of sigma E activity